MISNCQVASIVSIMKIEKSLKNVERGVDKTAAELALRRLQEELSTMPDLEEIKNEIWGRKDYVNLALHKCLSNLLIKQNPNRAVSDPIAIFVSPFSESELRAKFFSPLLDEELMQMIDYCDDQKKRTNGNYRPEFYEYLQRNFQIMIKMKELIKSIEKNLAIVRNE